MAAVDLLHELEQPACYPDGVTTVRVVQTHLSVVCITDRLAYKLKKAVALPFVDFSTLARRRQACADEVRLNRRLCPNVYLGTAALRRIDGQIRFGDLDHSDADDLDVAVVMSRLPQEHMLDERIAAQRIDADEIAALADTIAAFHAHADRGPEIRALGHPDRLTGFARDNFTDLRKLRALQTPAPLLDATESASERAFDDILPSLRQRAERGFVVDGHGDLHARNICMTQPPAIYDCIEFEPSFRCGDVATEVAFLAMDLRYRGEARLEHRFVDAYVDRSDDQELPSLLPTLCSYRAMVRSKVAALTANEAELPDSDRDHARVSAREHLMLAAGYLLEHEGPCTRTRPTWLVVCGPPASGKSTLARRIADRSGWPRFGTDEVRKQLAGIDPNETASPEHYSPEFSQRTYRELQHRATQATTAGSRVVVIDGNFPSRDRRDAVRAAADAAGAKLTMVVVGVDVETAVDRAAERSRRRDNCSDADPEVTRRLHAAFLAPTAQEGAISLDGTDSVEALAEQTLTALLS